MCPLKFKSTFFLKSFSIKYRHLKKHIFFYIINAYTLIYYQPYSFLFQSSKPIIRTPIDALLYAAMLCDAVLLHHDVNGVKHVARKAFV